MYHIIATRSFRLENHQRKVFSRGKGKISILQPGQADLDWVDEAWLKEHRHDLPPGTVIVQNGVTFSITKE